MEALRDWGRKPDDVRYCASRAEPWSDQPQMPTSLPLQPFPTAMPDKVAGKVASWRTASARVGTYTPAYDSPVMYRELSLNEGNFS